MSSSRSLLAGLLFVALATGCHGNGGPNGSVTYQATGSAAPAPADQPSPDLCLQVTNGSDVTISVEIITPDEDDQVGQIAPGETVTVCLDEYPAYATVRATACGPDSYGYVPTFTDDTVDDGTDYTYSDPFSGVDWTDPSDPSTTDGSSTDSSSTDSSSTDPAYAVFTTHSGPTTLFTGRKVARTPFARPITPIVTRRSS